MSLRSRLKASERYTGRLRQAPRPSLSNTVPRRLANDCSDFNSLNTEYTALDLAQAENVSGSIQAAVAIEELELWQQHEEISYNAESGEEYSTNRKEEEKDYNIESEEEEEKGYDIESEEEYNTDSIEEEKVYDIQSKEEYNTDSEEDTNLEEQDDDSEVEDESTIVDESSSFFEGFHGEYGPYFENFTSTMLFTWISKYMICESTVFFDICTFNLTKIFSQ